MRQRRDKSSRQDSFHNNHAEGQSVEQLLASKAKFVAMLKGKDTPKFVLDQLWEVDCKLTGRNEIVQEILFRNFPENVPQPTRHKPLGQ